MGRQRQALQRVRVHHTHPEPGYGAVEFGERSTLTRIYPVRELAVLIATTKVTQR